MLLANGLLVGHSWLLFLLGIDDSNNADPTKWTEGSIIGGSIWNSTWWPTAGGRGFDSTVSVSVGGNCFYWPSSPYPSVAYESYFFGFNYVGNIYPSNTALRSGGLGVRCVQEEQERKNDECPKFIIFVPTKLK